MKSPFSLSPETMRTLSQLAEAAARKENLGQKPTSTEPVPSDTVLEHNQSVPTSVTAEKASDTSPEASLQQPTLDYDLAHLEATIPRAWFEAIKDVSLTEMTPLEKRGLIDTLADYAKLTHPEALADMRREVLMTKAEVIDKNDAERLEQMKRELDILGERSLQLSSEELESQSAVFLAAVKTGKVAELPTENIFAKLPKLKYDLVEEQLKVSANQELSDAPVERTAKNVALIRQSIVFAASMGLAVGSFGATSVIGKMLMEKAAISSKTAKSSIEGVGYGVQAVNNKMIDLIFSIPGAPELLEKIYLQQDALMAKGATLGTGAYTIGAAFSALTLYYILRDKGLGWTKTGYAMLLASSLGGGYAVFKTAVDTDQLAQDAKAGVARIEPVRLRAEAAKDKVVQINKAIIGVVGAEVSAEAASGYGPVTSYIADFSTGVYDDAKFKAGAKAASKTDEWERSRANNETALDKLKAKYGLTGAQGIDALPGILLKQSLNTKQLDAAVSVLKQVAEKAQTANIYDNLWANINPFAPGASRLGLYNEEVALATELGNIPKQYLKLRPEIVEKLNAFAAEAIAIEPKAEARIKRIVTAVIEKLPKDLGFDAQSIEAMIKGIPVPDDTLPVPWGEDLNKLQASLTRTGINVDFSRAWEFSTDLAETLNNNRDIAIVLLLFLIGFMQLDTGSTNLDRVLGGSRARNRHYEDKMPKQFEAIQQREYVLSSLVSGYIEAQYGRVLAHVGTDSLAALKPPPDLTAMYIRRQLREQFEADMNTPGTVSSIYNRITNKSKDPENQNSRTPDSSAGRFIHSFVLGATPIDVDRMNHYGDWLNEVTRDFQRDPAMASAMLSRAFDPSHDALFKINGELDITTESNNRNLLVRKLESEALHGRVEMLKNTAVTISERISVLETRVGALNETRQNTDTADVLPFTITLDTSKPNFALPEQDVVKMVAIARAQTELSAARETLIQIQQMGLRLKSVPEFQPGYLKSDRFNFSYPNALSDQEIREREQGRVLGTDGVAATAEDMGRYHSIMQNVMSALEKKKSTITTDQYTSEFTPVFKYNLAEQRIIVELHKESAVGDTFATLAFPDPVPDFNSENPEEIAERIDKWLVTGSDEMRGMIAQAEHKELEQDMQAARKDVFAVTGNSMQVELFRLNSKISIGDEISSRVKTYLDLARLHRNQKKYSAKIGKGLPIDDKTFGLFTDPYSTQSLLTSEPNIEDVTEIINQLTDVPQEISIVFDIDTESIKVMAPESSKILSWKRSQKGSLSKNITLNEFSLDRLRLIIDQYKEAKVS